ncbi:ABC transporter permease [Myxococcota bacterium]|nr:ABC transporter permease [Myxococcota bacterium]MBU1411781.1 ABC transporter permease [Myxococcota bacterium]MBU1508990.1 ABC transporter permease [Myxococcota bacterium]
MLWNIVLKEVREMLTFTTIGTIIAVTAIFASMGGLVSMTKGETTKKPVIAVLDLDAPGAKLAAVVVATLSESCEVIYLGTDDRAGLKTLRANSRGAALIEIPAGFDAQLRSGHQGKLGVTWIMRGAGALDTISSAVMERHFLSVSRAVSRELVTARIGGADSAAADVIVDPIQRIENTFFKEKLIPMLSPAKISQILAAQSITVPIIMMIILMLGGAVVVSSMGLEKENKTLETLLTLPVSRRTLVMGKLLGSAIVGILMAGIFAIGFRFYIQNFEAPAESLAVLGLDLGIGDYILVIVSLFASLLFGLAFALLLGVLARDYKSAQMLTYAILVLAMFPMMIVMLKDFDTVPLSLQILLFIIPFSHPMMAMRQLALENSGFVLWGILYSFLAAGLLTAAVVRVFRAEVLVTGILRFQKRPAAEDS